MLLFRGPGSMGIHGLFDRRNRMNSDKLTSLFQVGESIWFIAQTYNAGKTITNHPFGNGLYDPFMVTWGMVYDCFTHSTWNVNIDGTHRLGRWLDGSSHVGVVENVVLWWFVPQYLQEIFQQVIR